MAKHGRKRDMRRATCLMWVCIAFLVLDLVMVLLDVAYSANYSMIVLAKPYLEIHLRYIVTQYFRVVALLLAAAFFCLCQRGYRSGQHVLLLPACAVAIYDLIYECYFCVRDPSLFYVVAVLRFLLEAAFLLILFIGLKRDGREIRKRWKILLIGLIAYGVLSVLTVANVLSLIYLVCKLLVYALIVYRVMAAGDITRPGYPLRGRALKRPSTQGSSTAKGGKSKVAAALLAFFLGTTGAHRYYLGHVGLGLVQACGFVSLAFGRLLITPARMSGSVGALLLAILFLLYGGAVGIWALVDFIRVLTGSLAPANGSGYAVRQVRVAQPADGSGYAARQVQAAQPAPAPAPAASSSLDDLEKLARLRDSGILTEEEFQRKKADILARM